MLDLVVGDEAALLRLLKKGDGKCGRDVGGGNVGGGMPGVKYDWPEGVIGLACCGLDSIIGAS